MDKMQILNDNSFSDLSQEELLDVEGGVIGTVCAVIGTAIAVGTAIYGYGYAKGQRDGYRDRYGY